MIMPVDVFSSLVKSKSHRAIAASAWREDFAGYRCDPVGVGVIVPVDFIVNHIVNTGCEHLIARLEHIIVVAHSRSSVIGFLPL
jgi:hypothetical protein